MNQASITQVESVFYPGWLMVSQLRCGQRIENGLALYQHACDLITTARSALVEMGYGVASCDQMLYALCALLDESVLNRTVDDDGYLTWHKDPLQARFFGTLNAGEELWDRIGELLESPITDISVLVCFYWTLQLGFVGRYQGQCNAHRQAVIQALYQRVSQHYPSDITSSATRVSKVGSMRIRYGLTWCMSIVVLIALWFVLSSQLAGQVAQLIKQG